MSAIDEALKQDGILRDPGGGNRRYRDAAGRILWIERKQSLRSIRDLRGAFLHIATSANADGDSGALLILGDPHITLGRLQEEWTAAIGVFNPGLVARMAVLVIKDGKAKRLEGSGEQGIIPSSLIARLKGAPRAEREKDTRPPSHYIITKLLMRWWLFGKEPVTRAEIARASGYSLPTVANSIERLRRYLGVEPYDRVKLAEFPAEAWQQLLSNSQEARKTVRFADTSRQPRSWEWLRPRITEVLGHRVAFGGVDGTRYWDPALDLRGVPRLDISVRSPGGALNVEFMRQVDPGLTVAANGTRAVRVVVHGVFDNDWAPPTGGPQSIPIADPVECLLDLHELRLTRQADELIERLRSRRLR